MEGQGRSWMVFSHHITLQVRKVIGGVVVFRIILSAPVPVPFLWTLDLGFGNLIWNLDLGLDLGLTIHF